MKKIHDIAQEDLLRRAAQPKSPFRSTARGRKSSPRQQIENLRGLGRRNPCAASDLARTDRTWRSRQAAQAFQRVIDSFGRLRPGHEFPPFRADFTESSGSPAVPEVTTACDRRHAAQKQRMEAKCRRIKHSRRGGKDGWSPGRRKPNSGSRMGMWERFQWLAGPPGLDLIES